MELEQCEQRQWRRSLVNEASVDCSYHHLLSTDLLCGARTSILSLVHLPLVLESLGDTVLW
jgi:hypothetical protein